MTVSDVSVKLDDRTRLMSAALAATGYPDSAQERRPHGTHAHARSTRKQLSAFKNHPAIAALNTLLDQRAPLEALFTLAMVLRFPDCALERPPRWMPPDWNLQLRDFYETADLANFWQQEHEDWDKALTDAQKAFESVQFKPFLAQFIGDFPERLFFIPNISYPTDQEMCLRLGNDLVCIIPPRLAWGESPPWPFNEDPAHVYRAALMQYGRSLVMNYLRVHADKISEISQTPLPIGDQFQSMYPTWQEQFTNLFVAGAVALYLQDHLSKTEADAYVMMERKVRGITILPGMISVLRRYLAEKEAGRYASLIDFLPVFPRQLKVANRIVAL
ncbi:MAG: hypothetical protein U0670_08975 [Anaerolineae bacterium]